MLFIPLPALTVLVSATNYRFLKFHHLYKCICTYRDIPKYIQNTVMIGGLVNKRTLIIAPSFCHHFPDIKTTILECTIVPNSVLLIVYRWALCCFCFIFFISVTCFVWAERETAGKENGGQKKKELR